MLSDNRDKGMMAMEENSGAVEGIEASETEFSRVLTEGSNAILSHLEASLGKLQDGFKENIRIVNESNLTMKRKLSEMEASIGAAMETMRFLAASAGFDLEDLAKEGNNSSVDMISPLKSKADVRPDDPVDPSTSNDSLSIADPPILDGQ